MKKAKKLISLLLALTMLLSMIPMAVAAGDAADDVATYSATPEVKIIRSTLDGHWVNFGTVTNPRQGKSESASYTQAVGEQDNYQLLPISTVNGNLYSPVAYYVPQTGSVTVSNDGIIDDLSFSMEPYYRTTGGFYDTPSLQFNFKAVAAGSTTVKVTYYYNFNVSNVVNGKEWYKSVSTFSITVRDEQVQKPDKPTESDLNRFHNRVNTTSTSEGAVYMWCGESLYDHGAWFDYLTEVPGAYTLGEVTANDGSVMSAINYPWTCTMTIDANKYLEAYNSELAGKVGQHYLKENEPEFRTVTWYYRAGEYKWKYIANNAPIYINITHDKPVTEETYVLHYDANGGEGAPASQTTKSNTGKATFTVSSAIPTRDGYTFLGWADDADATAVQYHGGDEITLTKDNPTKTIYAVWEAKNPQPPLIPAPSYDDLKSAIGQIQVKDVSTPSCGTENYDLIDNTESEPFNWTKTARADQPGKYDVTIKTAPYVAKYNSEKTKTHELNNANQTTLKLVISYENNKWVLDDGLRVIEVKHSEQNPPTDIPNPNPGNIAESLKVKVVCTTTNSGHDPAFYSLIDGTFTHTDVDQSGDYPTCSITISPDKYISRYSTDKNCQHTTPDDPKTVPLLWNKEAQKWAVNDDQIGLNGVVFNAVCEAVPDTFTVTYTDGVEDEVIFENDVHTGLNAGDATPAFVGGTPNREGYTFAGWEPEVAETVTETVTYAAKWTPVEPTHDDIFKALNGLVTVTCINRFWKDGNKNMDCGQGQYAAKAGIAGQDYTLVKGENAGTWVVTFPVTNFVKSFKQDPAHNLYTKDTLSWYIRWEDNAWTSEPVESGVDDLVKLTHAPTDWREVAKIATGGKSDCIHTSCVNGETGVCDYGITVPFVYFNTDVVSVEPEDGVPGSYIATFKVDRYIDTCAKACNDKNFPDAPRTHKLLTQETVQWRLYATSEADEKIGNNVLNHVWAADPVTPGTDDVCTVAHNWVVTFDPANGGDTFTQDVEYEGKATEPAAPEKTGYTFDGWYLDEAEEPFDFDTIITSDITLTAKWHVTPHNIYAFARLNSYFAPLTTKEFDTPITLNEATLSRLGLGSYNSLGYISIGSFTFDAMPLTGDLYFGDDAELSAVAEKLATDIALETGVSDKIAEKIAWTALYKTVNEEDMAPGYPAEAGYQLSGNLNLASVTFRAGAENVENMPAVNYTYDDGAIDFYDFYFAGDTFTMPADPTREGYIFEGWSVKVLPAENDADHLDADGADDAADETLLKAGDTYTITAGGVVFTAQWKKKTFTVKYYLPDETGAWVEKKMDTVDSVDYATYSLWTPNAEDGYEFSGWYQKTADIGVKAKVEKLYMAKEWKLYGKFTPIEYTIQYVYNDGKATSTNPTTYTVESDTITLADATGADWGKTFLEWHDENGQKITEIPTGSTGDRVITAYWNWPVHLHYLDKDNNEIESATLYVSELEPGACVLPTGEKTGYDFDGWYEAKKDIGTASHKLNALSIAKKWELYGRYTAKTDVSYTVKYLREGDNKVLAPEKVVTDQTFDTEVTEQAADVVGYTPDAPSKTMILDEYNKVLTFSYSANTYRYEIHYFLQEPDGSYMEKEVDTTPTGVFDTTVTITPDPNRYGAHYSYNSVKSVVSGVVTVDDPATILKLNVYYDLDFHTLTFETNGGSAIDPVTVRHGNAVARPADPTKDKYTFIGWYADPEFSAEYDFATVLEADKTIYAKFELTSTPIGDIYVRYDVLHIKQLPDGSYDLANAEVEHLSAKKDTTVTAVVKDYSATHHINVNSTLSKLTDTAIQPYPGADGKPVYTILSVYYDLDFHTLTFDTMGGSRIDPVTVRHGNAVAKPKDPVNGGYIFDGWYTDKTYRTPYNFATVLTQDTTIYAKWFLIALPGVTIKKTTPKLNTSDHFAYVQGYPDGTVKPAGNITRAETAAILFRLMDEGSRKTYYSTKSGFRDVATGSWYNTYVATLNNAGVITDSSNGYFRPNEAITRAELAAMLANFTETAGAANYFNDVSARYWAANAIAICAKLGWITGYPDGSFRPDRNVTRAELMAMINRATGRAPKSADAFLPGMKTWSDNTADKWYYLDVQEATNSHSYTVKDSEKWTALNADPNWSLYE